MQPFEKLFRESKGQPVVYNGLTIQLVDRFPVSDGQLLKVTFDSADSKWRQGINLTTDGSFVVNAQTVKKSVVLWQDTAPREVVLKIQTKKGECWVKNVWDVGNGSMESWHNGAAMVVEELTSGRRYMCNDGQPDDDFNDLIFRIEQLK